jgi:ProP effector
VAGAARVDLDGIPCGEVTAADQEHAAARLTEIQAAREAKRAAAAAGTRTAKQAAAVAPVSVTKVPTLKAKPVLHLPVNQSVASRSARATALAASSACSRLRTPKPARTLSDRRWPSGHHPCRSSRGRRPWLASAPPHWSGSPA